MTTIRTRRSPGITLVPHRLHHVAADLSQTLLHDELLSLLERYNATAAQPLALVPAVQEGWCMDCGEWVALGHECGGQK